MKDPSKLHYGSVLLNHGAANDMVVFFGRLENNLYAYAQPDDTKSAIQLSGDMGTYFFPFPGTRINRETIPLNLNPWIGDFERSSAVLVRCGRGVDLPGACVIGWPVPLFLVGRFLGRAPGVAGGQGLDGGGQAARGCA